MFFVFLLFLVGIIVGVLFFMKNNSLKTFIPFFRQNTNTYTEKNGSVPSFTFHSDVSSISIDKKSVNIEMIEELLNYIDYRNSDFNLVVGDQHINKQEVHNIEIRYDSLLNLNEEQKKQLQRITLSGGELSSGVLTAFSENTLSITHYLNQPLLENNDLEYLATVLSKDALEAIYLLKDQPISEYNDFNKFVNSLLERGSLFSIQNNLLSVLKKIFSVPQAYAQVCTGSFSCGVRTEVCSSCPPDLPCNPSTKMCGDGVTSCSCSIECLGMPVPKSCSVYSSENTCHQYFSNGCAIGACLLDGSCSWSTPPPPGATATPIPPGEPTPTTPPSAGCGSSCTSDSDCGYGNVCVDKTDGVGHCWGPPPFCPGEPSVFSCSLINIRDNISGDIWQSNGTYNFCGPLTNSWTWEVDAEYVHEFVRFYGGDAYAQVPVNSRGATGFSFNPNVAVPYDQTKRFRSYAHRENGSGNDKCKPDIYFKNTCTTRDSQCQGYAFPSSMYANSQESVAVHWQNTGAETWSPTWTTSADYATIPGRIRMGSSDPQDNYTWQKSRVYMPAGTTVPLASTYTFGFDIISPSIVGKYSSKWQMLKEGVSWFGEQCGPNAITVFPSCPTNVQLTCTTPTQLQVSWTSSNLGIDHYNVRANSDPFNDAQCQNGNGDWIGWACVAQGDQYKVTTDANQNSATETNSYALGVTPGVLYSVTVQGEDHDVSEADVPRNGEAGCQSTPVYATCIQPTPTPTTIPTPTPGVLSGNFYLGTGNISGGRCIDPSGTYTSMPQNTDTDVVVRNSVNTIQSTTVQAITPNHTSSVLASDSNYRVTFTPGNPGPDLAYVINCPSTGIYTNVDPKFTSGGANTKLNFFVTELDLSNGPWWQASGASVYGLSGITTYIPAETCDVVGPSGGCYSGMIAGHPFDTSTIKNTAGFPMTLSGSIISHADGENHIHPVGARDVSDNGQVSDFTLPEEKYTDFEPTLGGLASDISSSNYPTVIADQTNIFKYTGTLTIDDTHNWDVAANESVIVLVEGNLIFDDTGSNSQITTVADGGFLAFIVSGNITINDTVGHTLPTTTTTDPASLSPNLEGVFIADGTITVASQSPVSPDKKFIGAGTFVGWSGVTLGRDFTQTADPLSAADNNTNATETFIYRPDLVQNTPYELKSAQVVWQEAAPDYQ